MKKRIISFVMALVMMISLMPGAVFATDSETPEETVQVAAETTETTVATTETTAATEAPTETTAATEAPTETTAATEASTETTAVTEAPAETTAATEAPTETTEATKAPTETTAATEAPAETTAATEAPAETTAATEAPTETTAATETPTEATEATETPTEATEATEAATEATERVCLEGCILEGEAEHLENGGECLVWIACTLTEGCEGSEGHEGDCYGASVFDAGTINVQARDNTVKNAYIVVGTKDGAKNDTLYKTNSNGVICDLNGNAVAFAEGTYYIWYGTEGSTANRSFYSGSVTVESSSQDAKLTTARNTVASSEAAITEDQWNWATCVYYNTDTCDHIHIRVAGSYTIDIGGTSYAATVSNPEMTVYVNGAYNTSKSWSGTTNYEWTYKTNISLSNEIEVHLTMDLTYRDSTGSHTLEDVEIVYNNMTDRNRWIEFIAICDGIQGFDFTVSIQDIQEVIEYYNVVYQWRIYNLDGTTSTDLPASVGSHGLPASVSGLAEGTQYVYNTGYVEGTSYHDYENGLLYTFHGWDTWSHSSVWDIDTSATGYHKLDDGDSDASNNETIEITADTWINGYWTVSELPAADAYLMVHKDVVVDSGDADYVKNYLQNIGKMFISIDPGIDKDNDGKSQIDVDYPGATAEGGYRINVYQYEKPFIFDEYQMEVPGYTRTTVISTSGSNLSLVSEADDTVTGTHAVVSIQEEYDPEQAPYNLGTVTYTNIYTKNTGDAVSVYPSLYLLKSASDGGFQDGVEFTLCNEDYTKTYTTADDGQLLIDFTGMTAGTYYLKETKALDGYKADPCEYSITLSVSEEKEELRDNKYVEVTYYTLSVTVPEGSTAVYRETKSTNSHSLHIYNDPILGSLNVSKTANNLDEADKDKLNAVVIVHGPISYTSVASPAEGADTIEVSALGSTWTLNLNSENEWKASISELPVGEYLIHESFASVHGYTWTGVTYDSPQTVRYNGITSGLFEISEDGSDDHSVELTLTNDYSEWTSADFYIKKVSPDGAALQGAAFQLFMDEACRIPATGTGITLSATTGADGYAHFTGYTVPEGQDSVTYYLKETKAPAGYYLDGTVYEVEIKAVSNNGKTAYEPKITGTAVNFDNTTDLLTVTNSPVLGELAITKTMTGAPAEVSSVSVVVSGPDGYTHIANLNQANDWSVTLENLPLGEYTIYEQDASVPGYTWEVAYSSRTVTLTEENPGYTAAADEISGSVSITNTYTKREETYEIPTMLTVKKVAEDGTTPLAGAVFQLDRLDTDGKTVINTVSFTTNSEGIVLFDMLSGFIVDGDDVEGKYILSETAAPEGYQATATTWTVTVKDEDGELRVVLNENRNIFENFWDWIVGGITGEGSAEWTWEDGVLTVENVKKTGDLTITKAVVDEEEYYADAEYSFALDCSDDDFDRTFTLEAGVSKTIEDIPWGTTYTLTENTTGAAFTSSIDSPTGKIWADETEITVTNTYAYQTHNNGLNLVKVDADDNSKVIAGAGFTLYADEECRTKVGDEVFSDASGNVKLDIAAAGTYYLKETTTPTGYHPNEEVYVVTAEQEYVALNAGTANAVTEIQMHITIAGLTGSAANQIDYTYSIENTAIRNVVVTVEKIWDDGGYHNRPESVEVVLYRDNEEYATVTLNDDNNWRYTWDNLTDEYDWSVDEENIPFEYSKNVENKGSNWTITNTRTPRPIEISVTKAWQHNGGKDLPESIEVTLYKDGKAYETVTVSEDNDWTYTWKNLTDVSVWSVDETEVPVGYTKEIITEDGHAFTIVNTRTINPVEVHVTKVWAGSEGVTHPESVKAVLYRDGVAYDTVTLNEKNGWSHTWKDLTDEYTWSVDEKDVPAGYTRNVTNDGTNFTITNTKNFKEIDVSVNKVWYGSDVTHPTSVKVTLYRDGVAYDTVTLSKSNNWSYTWADLTDEFEWKVDEPSVPSGYNKTVRQNGYKFTITNTYEDIPKTGDESLLSMWAVLALLAAAGMVLTGTKMRKKSR